MAGIAGMITEGKNSDFIRIFMVATVEVRIFLALLSPSYEKFVVTLRMATLSKILIMCVGLVLFGNLWAQSCFFALCPFLWGCAYNFERKGGKQ